MTAGETFGVADQVTLVTGASSGLGQHFARLLARHGSRVALAARRGDRLDELAREIAGAGGIAAAIEMDVTDPASVAEGVARAEARLGPVRILINNSGIAATRLAIEQTPVEWDAILRTNLTGAFLVAQAVARQMMSHGGGSIVNIASILGHSAAMRGVGAYSASKAGLISLTQTLALELAKHNIRVNALCPGYIETDLNREFLGSEAGQALLRRVALRRAGRIEELDMPLLMLAGRGGSFLTGSCITADGGFSIGP
jgi:NAD(P)-dependent dehydrogenase (short-subunit alcohol dehydrogenase family)